MWKESLDKMEVSFKRLKIQQERTRHNEAVPINRLLVEMFSIILSHLDRGDLFVYESVCTKWSHFVKLLAGERLVISKWKPKTRPQPWLFLNRLYLPSSVMVRADFAVKLIENSFMFNLRQLKICDTFYEWEENPDILLNDTFY